MAAQLSHGRVNTLAMSDAILLLISLHTSSVKHGNMHGCFRVLSFPMPRTQILSAGYTRWAPRMTREQPCALVLHYAFFRVKDAFRAEAAMRDELTVVASAKTGAGMDDFVTGLEVR